MKGWKEVLAKVAPVLGTALGGPLAGMAVKAIGDKVLGKPDATEDDIATALASGDSTTLLKLKELDVQFKKDMAQVGVDLEKLAMEDRSSARAREIAVRDRMPMVLGTLVTLGFFGLLCAFLWVEPPQSNKEVLYIMLGSLGASFSGVVGYYFGTSSGSEKRAELRARNGG